MGWIVLILIVVLVIASVKAASNMHVTDDDNLVKFTFASIVLLVVGRLSFEIGSTEDLILEIGKGWDAIEINLGAPIKYIGLITEYFGIGGVVIGLYRKLQEIKLISVDSATEEKHCEDREKKNDEDYPVIGQPVGKVPTWKQIQLTNEAKNEGGEFVAVEIGSDMITCPRCGMVQKSNRTCCFECGVKFEISNK